MKRIFLWIFLIAFSIVGYAQSDVVVGLGNSTSDNHRVPSHMWFNYSATQTIYLSDDIGVSGYITTISYFNTVASVSTTRTIQVYMGETDITSLSSSNVVPDSLLTLVYSGPWNVTGNTWSEIVLDVPFQYSGSSNLVIAMIDATGSNIGNGKYWRSTNVANRAIYYADDNSPYVMPGAFSGSGNVITQYPDVTLTFSNTGTICPGLTGNLVISNITTGSADVDWTDVESGASYEIQYKAGNQAWDDPDVFITTTSTNSYSLSGLNASTAYDVRVRHLCSDGSTSSWKNATFHTLCDIVTTFPFEEGFESDWAVQSFFGQNNAAPNCWTVYDGGYTSTSASTPYKWQYNNISSRVYEGTGSAACYTDYATSQHNDWLISPLMQLTGNEMLTFYAQRASSTSTEPEEISIWISEENATLVAPVNDTDPLPGFTQIYQTDIPAGTFQEYTVILNNYSGARYIAFVRRNLPNDGYWLSLDNVKVSEAPNCMAPTALETVLVSATDAELTWSSITSPVDLYYRPSGDTTYSVEMGAYLDGNNVYMLTNLTPATTYEWYVEVYCEDSTYTSNVNTFTTTCEGIATLPWTENFDSLSAIANGNFSAMTGDHPQCWNRVGSGVLTLYSGSYTYGASGYSMMFYPNGNFGSPNVAILPPFEEPISNLMFSCLSRPEGSSSGSFDIGYMTNIADPNSFVVTGHYVVSDYSSPYAYQQNIATFVGAPDGARIAIRQTTSANWFWFVDSIVVSIAPSCMAPAALAQVSQEAHATTLTWASNNSVFDLYYKAQSDNTYTVLNGISLDADSTYTITNLPSSTVFTWYVQAICDEGDTVTSQEATFLTTCEAVVVDMTTPFVESFNALTAGIPNCWDNSEGTISDNDYKWSYYANGESGACLRMNSYYASNGSYNVLKTPVLDLSLLSSAVLSFTYKNPTGGDFSVYLSTDGGVSYPTSIATGLTGASDWTQVEYVLPTLTDASNVVVVFKGTSNYGSGDAYLYLDNVKVSQEASCSTPSSPQTVTVGSDYAELTWQSNALSFDLYYRETGDTAFMAVQGVTLDANNVYTLTNLTPATNYEWYVAAICDDGTMPSSLIRTFMTSCVGLDSIPYTWTFETGIDGGTSDYPMANCWGRITPASTSSLYPYVYSYSSYAHSGTHSLYFYNYYSDSYAVMPMIDNTALTLTDLQVSFFAKLSSTSYPVTLEVGVMTNPTDATTFTLVQTVNLTSDYPAVPYTVMFSNYTGNGQYIAFRNAASSAYNNMYIDDVTLELQPACPPAQNVVVSGVTGTEATVSWTGNSANGYDVRYHESGSTTWLTTTASTETITLTGLTSSTTYVVEVAPICPDGPVAFVGTTFTTACEGISTFPYIESFESGTLGCWTNEDVYHSTSSDTSRWVATATMPIISASPVDGSYMAFHQTAPSYSSNAASLVSPLFDLSGLNNPYVSFHYCNLNYTSYVDSMSVWYRTSPTADWTFLKHYDGVTTFAWSFDSLSLPNPTATYQIAFRATDHWGYGTVLDMITVYNSDGSAPATCDAPTGLAVNNPSQTSATATWTAGGTETSWNVQYKTTTASNWQSATANTTSYTMTGLTPGTQYQVRVQAVCDATTTSTWTGIVSFTTANEDTPTCPAPTNLHAELGDSHTTIILTWQQEANTANEWQVNYRQTTESSWSTATANATSYTLTDLVPNVTYEFNVVAHCTNGLTSDESNTVTFETNNIGVEDYLNKAVTLYPNPATEMVSVAVSDANIMITGVEVYNVYGQLINTIVSTENLLRINVSGLADGMYYVRVTTDNGVVTKNFVKR